MLIMAYFKTWFFTSFSIFELFINLWPGLWIHIHLLWIRIHLFFSMRIRIQQLFKCRSGSESSLTKFEEKKILINSWRRHQDCSKVKNHGAGPNLQKKFNLNYNFFQLFFIFSVFSSKFSSMDPDPQPCLWPVANK